MCMENVTLLTSNIKKPALTQQNIEMIVKKCKNIYIITTCSN